MKIRFVIKKYDITITEENWCVGFLPQRGDKIDLFNFLLNDRGNVQCPIEALGKINKHHNTQYADYVEYFAMTRFTIEEFVWIKEAEGIYCEIHVKD